MSKSMRIFIALVLAIGTIAAFALLACLGAIVLPMLGTKVWLSLSLLSLTIGVFFFYYHTLGY